MHYEDFSAEDFLLDEFFRKWLLDPDPLTIHFWETWLDQHPEKSKDVTEAKEILAHFHFREYLLSETDSQQLWKTILMNRQDSGNSKILTQRKVSSIWDNWGYTFKVAAAILIFLLTGISFYLLSTHNNTIEYLTKYGETREIHLPDSSIVVLNANSKLIVPSNWDPQRTREVWLKGEAFFYVRKKPVLSRKKQSHNELIRFTVHTKALDVNVVGTEFNVNDRRGRTRVMLQQGKVKLSLNQMQPNSPIMMNPGELVEAKSGQVRKKKVNPELYSSWVTHKLVLDYTPLSEIVSILEDNFGYKVILRNPMHAHRLVKGTLPLDNMDILLDALTTSLNLKMTRNKGTIVFENN